MEFAGKLLIEQKKRTNEETSLEKHSTYQTSTISKKSPYEYFHGGVQYHLKVNTAQEQF